MADRPTYKELESKLEEVLDRLALSDPQMAASFRETELDADEQPEVTVAYEPPAAEVVAYEPPEAEAVKAPRKPAAKKESVKELTPKSRARPNPAGVAHPVRRAETK